MKKLMLFPLFALLMTACANDESIPTEEPGKENVARSFLSVSLVAPRSASRADSDKYQDGTASENNVKSVRFFFFNANEEPAQVWKQAAAGTYLSYIDWTPTDADIADGPVLGQTVEKIVTATLGINMPDDAEYPALVLAVLNPVGEVSEEFGPDNCPSLGDLRMMVDDYYTDLHENNFVITNSVYAKIVETDGGEKKVSTIDATPIDEDCFQSTADEAALHPLIIYVERVLARLDLSIGIEHSLELEDGSVIYPTRWSDDDDAPEGVDEPAGDGSETDKNGSYLVDGKPQQIYVRFLGWNVTAVTNSSRLVKNINPSWPTGLFGFGDSEPWNADNYHRSFWAVNPQNVEHLYGSFNKDLGENNWTPAVAKSMPAPDAFETVYLQENAGNYGDSATGAGPATPSKVILAAQLVDNTGKALTIAHWAQKYYTTDATDPMKDGLLTAVANSLNLYQKTTKDGEVQFVKILPSDLQLVAANKLPNGALTETVPGYYVYVQLSDQAKNIDWYNGNTETSPKLSASDANTYIINRANYAYVWKNGYTYYYFDILHLGADGNPGYEGVVRNHLYKANVTSVAGLGTPVYNPDDVIYPEKPKYDNSVLSVEIRILQWRIVRQEYDLKWE